MPVKLGARLTEVGTLEIWADSRISDHRWRLQFELRKRQRRTARRTARPAAVISETAMQAARELIAETFGPPDSLAPEELPSKLEAGARTGPQVVAGLGDPADWRTGCSNSPKVASSARLTKSAG